MADINNQLLINIEQNNIGEVIRLLNEGADINYQDGYLLYIACQCGYHEIIKILLNEGINYDKQWFGSLLGYCICHDDVDSLKLLIQFDLVNIVDDKYFINDYNWQQKSIQDLCIEKRAKNIFEFIIDNYPEIIPNDIHICKEDIQKYSFIKMLINRDFIDVPD